MLPSSWGLDIETHSPDRWLCLDDLNPGNVSTEFEVGDPGKEWWAAQSLQNLLSRQVDWGFVGAQCREA